MGLISATEAARRLKKTDKTIRQWVKDGKLYAVHISSRQLGIDERDIIKLASNMGIEIDVPPAGQAEQIAQLQREIASLRADVTRLASIRPDNGIAAPDQEPIAVDVKVQAGPASIIVAPPIALPDTSVDVHTFASIHGINRSTVKHHYAAGIDGDVLQVTAVPVHNRPGQYSRFLTSEQQKSALDYWQRHKVRYQSCKDCPHG
jgi:hypothetical protein